MSRDVVVVGGGCAGLSAATALASLGAKVRLLEARRTLGGRSRSFVNRATGDVEDNGQHLFMGCYSSFLEFAGRTGGADAIEFAPRLEVVSIHPGGAVSKLEPASLPPPLDLMAGLARLRGFPVGDLAAAGSLVRDVRRGAPRAQGRTVAEWLDLLGASSAGRAVLWDPLTLAALNLDPGAAPAVLFAEVVKRSLLGGPGAARLGFAERGLDAVIARPARAYLGERGGEVLFGKVVERIETAGGRFASAVCRDGSRHEAGAAVLAVPPRAAAALLPRGASDFGPERAEALGASPIVEVHLWFDRAVADRPMVGLVGSPVQWVFRRETAGGSAAGYAALLRSAADDWIEADGAEIVRSCLEELRRFVPASRAAVLLRWRVIKEREATARFTPANLSLRPPAETALPNLALAGDWTDTGLPATLEGAAASGERAAAILAGKGDSPYFRQERE